MSNPTNFLTGLAESKMIIDRMDENDPTIEDHIDIIEYIGSKRVILSRRIEKEGVINLSEENFKGIHIHAEFKRNSIASFSHSTLDDCFIVNQDLRYSLFNDCKIIRGAFGKTNFDESDFSYSSFVKVNAYSASFRNCKFRYMKYFSSDSFFIGDFYGIDWRGTDFTGTDLSWISTEKIVEINSVHNTDFFEGCIGIDENILKQIKMNTIRKKMF